MFSYFDLLVQLADLLKVILGILFAAIDGFNSDVIRLQSQKSDVLPILIYTRLKINRKLIFVEVSTTEACFISNFRVFTVRDTKKECCFIEKGHSS